MQTLTAADRIAPHVEHATGLFNPPHEVADADKRDALMRDMADHGWRGAPLLVYGEDAITGSHRIAAVRDLWNREGIEVTIPYMEVSSLCEEYGIDWDDLSADFGDLTDLVTVLTTLLPAEVVDYLGLDLH